MLDQEAITQQLDFLAAYRRTLVVCLHRQVINGIETARAQRATR